MAKRTMDIEELLNQIEKSKERIVDIERKVLIDVFCGVYVHLERYKTQYKEAMISLEKQEKLRDAFYENFYK